MKTIPSFQKDHDKLKVGLYVSMQMQNVTTFDLRFKKPNSGDFITPKALHTIEHILATILRNSDKSENIIYFGPMGCRTGFYLLTVNLSYDEVKELLIDSFEKSLSVTEIPGNKKHECGNYLEHDLKTALYECEKYLKILKELKND